MLLPSRKKKYIFSPVLYGQLWGEFCVELSPVRRRRPQYDEKKSIQSFGSKWVIVEPWEPEELIDAIASQPSYLSGFGESRKCWYLVVFFSSNLGFFFWTD